MTLFASHFFRVQTATRKSFNISGPSRELYEGYQIFISRQQPPVKSLRNFCGRKKKPTWKRTETRCGERKRRAGTMKGRALHMQCSTKTYPLMCHGRTWRYTFHYTIFRLLKYKEDELNCFPKTNLNVLSWLSVTLREAASCPGSGC